MPNVKDSTLIARVKKIHLKYWKDTVGTSARQKQTYEKISSMLHNLGNMSVRRDVDTVDRNCISSAMRLFVDADSDSEQSELDDYIVTT